MSQTVPANEIRIIPNLIKAANLSDEIFGRAARKQVKDRLTELAESPGNAEQMGDAVSETVQAVQVAVIAAVATAVIISSASSSH